jgi:hypothetical protein
VLAGAELVFVGVSFFEVGVEVGCFDAPPIFPTGVSELDTALAVVLAECECALQRFPSERFRTSAGLSTEGICWESGGGALRCVSAAWRWYAR